MNKKALLMNLKDDVVTVIEEIDKGDIIDILHNGKVLKSLQANEHIDYYHKIAIKKILLNDKVHKYGEVIGKATQGIEVGDHVHVHNIESAKTI